MKEKYIVKCAIWITCVTRWPYQEKIFILNTYLVKGTYIYFKHIFKNLCWWAKTTCFNCFNLDLWKSWSTKENTIYKVEAKTLELLHTRMNLNTILLSIKVGLTNTRFKERIRKIFYHLLLIFWLILRMYKIMRYVKLIFAYKDTSYFGF